MTTPLTGGEISNNQEMNSPPVASHSRSFNAPLNPISELLWKEAFESLSPSDQESLQRSNGGDIIKDILDSMAVQKKLCERNSHEFKWKGQVYRSSDIADKVISWVQTFIKVGDTIVQYDPVHAALPWAAFRFILQVAVNSQESMGASLLGIERIVNIMVRTSIYEALYLSFQPLSTIETNLKTQIVQLYAKILDFIARTKKKIYKGGVGRIVSAIFECGDTKEKLVLLEQSASSIDTTASTVDAQSRRIRDRELREGIHDGRNRFGELQEILTKLNAPLSDIARKLDALYKSLELTRRKEILTWLSSMKYINHHREIQKGLVENTGEWLFDHPDFLEWERSQESRVLWLHGIPGAGKTRLASAVVERLTERPTGAAHSQRPIPYFYCIRTEEDRRDPAIILASLLKQLGTCTENLPAMLVSAYESRERNGSQERLDCDECQELIVKIINISQPTTLVIDALDEMEMEGRLELLKAIKFIIFRSTPVVKIFISSRMSNDIELALEDVPRINIRARDNQKDINKFIRREIDKAILEKRLLGGSVHPDLRDKIENALSEKVDGMFQWVALQIPYICEFQIAEDVEKNLSRLPDTLQQSYDLIYERIERLPGSSPILVKRALMWIMCSQVPLKLDTWTEAVRWSAQEDGWSGWDFDHLFKLCQNLVDIDGELGVVRFAHLSVREFLVEKNLEGDGHRMMAEGCAAILALPYSEGDTTPSNIIRRIGYAYEYWGTHMMKSPRKDVDSYPHSVNMLVLPERRQRWMEGSYGYEPFSTLWEVANEAIPWDSLHDYIGSKCHYLFIFALLGIHVTDQYWPPNAATMIDADDVSLFERAIEYDHLQMLTKLLDNGGEIPGDVLERVQQRSLPKCSQRATELIENYLASRTPAPDFVVEPPPRWTVPFLQPIIQVFRWFTG